MSDVGRRRIFIIAAGILRKSGHPKKAAELAERALTGRLGGLDIQALDEYVRSSIEAGERPALNAYRDLEKDRMRRLKMESSNCIRYRIGAASLLNGSVHAAEADLRGFISGTFSGYKDDPGYRPEHPARPSFCTTGESDTTRRTSSRSRSNGCARL